MLNTIPYMPKKQTINQAALLAKATVALNLNKQIQDLTAILDAEKVYFRDLANGEKLSIDVPFVGNLTVTTPSAATSGTRTTTTFSPEKFATLPLEMQTMLKKMGVVTVSSTPYSTPAGTAAVRLTLNK